MLQIWLLYDFYFLVCAYIVAKRPDSFRDFGALLAYLLTYLNCRPTSVVTLQTLW